MAEFRNVPDSKSKFYFNASVAELVDAPDSKSGSVRSVGSIPTRGTKKA